MMEYKLKEFYKGLIKYMTQALEENLLLRVVLVAQLAEQSFRHKGPVILSGQNYMRWFHFTREAKVTLGSDQIKNTLD